MTEHIETGTQTSPTAEYEPLKVDFTSTPAVVPLVAWTWNTPVIPQFYWNVYSAEQRVKQICLEIGRIQEYLNYFAAHYNKMSGYLNKRIDKLTAAMYAEVERLNKAIEEENKARKLADELLQKGLDAEIARAKAAEIVLQQNIDANTTLIEDEEKRAKDAEEKLTTDLHDETAARIAEDKKINNTVETNRQHAEEVDAQLFDSIRTEANLRKNADNLLSDRIDKETEERKADDASINTRIDNEHAERVKADNELDKRVNDNQQAVEHEVERAKSVETNLNDALEREIDARVDTDRSLENSIDANDRASKERDNKLQGNIDAEIANRGNAENAINDRITNEISARKADDASINTRIDKETEERKSDVVSLNTRADNEQTERIKADNALDKRVTDNVQSIEHETERAKSAETNLNDALEREVDARQDDTRNLENLIDKANNDSKNRDDILQNKLDDYKSVIKTYIDRQDSLIRGKVESIDSTKLNVNNIKAAKGSHITVTTADEDTTNATVTIGDTFSADFDKVNNDIEVEKQRAIAKENELSGKVEHETQERQTETTALNAEVAKRPTLDKFIAGENITLTPDIDKTTLTISAKQNLQLADNGGLSINSKGELCLNPNSPYNYKTNIFKKETRSYLFAREFKINDNLYETQIFDFREPYVTKLILPNFTFKDGIFYIKYSDPDMLKCTSVNVGVYDINNNLNDEIFSKLNISKTVIVEYPYIYAKIKIDTIGTIEDIEFIKNIQNNFSFSLTYYATNVATPIKEWAPYVSVEDAKYTKPITEDEKQKMIKELNEANKDIHIYALSMKSDNSHLIFSDDSVSIEWFDGSISNLDIKFKN